MEILVVMVIIVVLATLTISIYTWLETRKNEQAAESIVRKIEMGLSSYHNDHDRYPPERKPPSATTGQPWRTTRNQLQRRLHGPVRRLQE